MYRWKHTGDSLASLEEFSRDAECLRSLRPKAAQTATPTAQRPWLRHAPHCVMSHVLSRALKNCCRFPAVLAQSAGEKSSNRLAYTTELLKQNFQKWENQCKEIYVYKVLCNICGTSIEPRLKPHKMRRARRSVLIWLVKKFWVEGLLYS